MNLTGNVLPPSLNPRLPLLVVPVLHAQHTNRSTKTSFIGYLVSLSLSFPQLCSFSDSVCLLFLLPPSPSAPPPAYFRCRFNPCSLLPSGNSSLEDDLRIHQNQPFQPCTSLKSLHAWRVNNNPTFLTGSPFLAYFLSLSLLPHPPLPIKTVLNLKAQQKHHHVREAFPDHLGRSDLFLLLNP